MNAIDKCKPVFKATHSEFRDIMSLRTSRLELAHVTGEAADVGDRTRALSTGTMINNDDE